MSSEKRECDQCHEIKEDCFWTNDPYMEEIYPESENPESWWCGECYQNARYEI